MEIKRPNNFKDYFYQAILIIFSVLFALLINRYTENLKIKKQKNIALESIRQELKNNYIILTDWQERHEEILLHTQKLLKLPDDSLQKLIFSTGSFNFGAMTGGKSLLDDIPSSTSWETAKSTGIISEFDYDTIEKLTKIYALQDNILNYTLSNLMDLFYERATQNHEELKVTLVLFHSLFNELLGQENLLLNYYNQMPDVVPV
jgi:hypothetical protein